MKAACFITSCSSLNSLQWSLLLHICPISTHTHTHTSQLSKTFLVTSSVSSKEHLLFSLPHVSGVGVNGETRKLDVKERRPSAEGEQRAEATSPSLVPENMQFLSLNKGGLLVQRELQSCVFVKYTMCRPILYTVSQPCSRGL